MLSVFAGNVISLRKIYIKQPGKSLKEQLH